MCVSSVCIVCVCVYILNVVCVLYVSVMCIGSFLRYHRRIFQISTSQSTVGYTSRQVLLILKVNDISDTGPVS